MTALPLLETKGFSDSPFLLPCILDTNFFSWTSTLSICMGTWKKSYTRSNHRVLMMDQAECVYFKSAWQISKSVEDWIPDQKARKAQTHTGCPCEVWEEWDFTISAPVYWRYRSCFLLPQRKQGLHSNGAPFDSKKVSGIWRWKPLILMCAASSSEVWCNSLPGQDHIFNIPCQCFPNSFKIQLEEYSTTSKLLKIPFFS